MARLLLTHIVGAQDLEPELHQMVLAANAWVLEDRGGSQWLIDAPDLQVLHYYLLPGWAVQEADDTADLADETLPTELVTVSVPLSPDEPEATAKIEDAAEAMPEELLELDDFVSACMQEILVTPAAPTSGAY